MTFDAFLNAEQWVALSAIGQVASAIVAFFGLGFIGVQIRAARRTSDLQSLQEFLRSATEGERALLLARDGEEKERAFFEFANFLELQAAALHGRLFPKVTRAVVREKLRDSVAVIEQAEPWMEKLRQGRSSSTAFEHLLRFANRQRASIDAVKRQAHSGVPSSA